MNILVVRLSALGDVAMTIPAIYSVARAYPSHRFTVVTSAFPSRLFLNTPDNVVVVPLQSSESRGFMGTWRLLRKLGSLDIDAVADLHNVLRSWVVDSFFRLRGKPVAMVDKRRNERRAILHEHASTSRPFVFRYFDVFARLGLSAEPQFQGLGPLEVDAGLEIPVIHKDEPQAGGREEPLVGSKDELQAGGREEPLVGIAPFARYKNKIYSPSLMQQVVRLLHAKGARVYLFGARGQEAETMQQWAEGLERVTVVAGRLQLEQELALMARLDVMLTMDSANMHLASLVGTRVVSFWGGTTPACGFLGFGQRPSDALQAGLDCQPCTIAGTDHCPLGHMHCISHLSPSFLVSRLLSS